MICITRMPGGRLLIENRESPNRESPIVSINVMSMNEEKQISSRRQIRFNISTER